MATPFPSRSLAARIERAESDLVHGAVSALIRQDGSAGFIRPLAGGVATFAGPGSPFNKVAGLGFGDAVRAEDLDEIEQLFTESGAPTQVELSSMADPAVGALLSSRGYRLTAFENVLGLSLRDAPTQTTPDRSDGLAIGRDSDFDAWLETIVGGFAVPDSPNVPRHEGFSGDVIRGAIRHLSRASGFTRFLATLDQEPVGAASMRIGDGIAQFCGAATLPPFRRRGVQTALLKERLAEAARQECDVAVVTTQPGSASHSNVHRFGFRLLYTRAILLLEPEAA